MYNNTYKSCLHKILGSLNKGSIAAQSQLGVFYYNGTGVAINKKRAIELLRKAARGGNKNSQSNLRKLGLRW